MVNPKATTTSARTRDVLTGALRSEMELTVGYTRRRGHGFDLAQDAASDSIDVVVALGGDGTVNEVVNGLMAGTSEKKPALAVVPGGSTNVFVRAVGLPRQAVEATGVILSALRSGTSRLIGLGRADERYFTFCAGIGLDAAVVRRVEQARRRGRRSTPVLYMRSALGEYLFDAIRQDPGLTIAVPGEPDEVGLANVIVQNAAPWTFLGDRPVHASPDASFDSGLDLLALRVFRPPSTLQTVGRMLSLQRDQYGKRVMLRHDLAEFMVTCSEPQPFQLDGDYLGEREKVKFTSVAEALRVIC